MSRKKMVFLIFFLVLLLDQSVKIWVKTHMAYGEEIQVFGWDRVLIHFVENDGMAFGMRLGGEYGKLLLSLFRITAVGFLLLYLIRLVKENSDRWLVAGFALVLSGAVGNIVDSVLYGKIFSASSFDSGPAQLFPEGGGYAPFLYGRVVDMFYFPLLYGNYPDWIPYFGGKAFLFFRPVFNIADVAISMGVVTLLYFYFRLSVPQELSQEEE
ncbi:lipoprotein signal peptidase [Neolewinella agarilytica]|uniref:Lipoprotein signal peptidase n=1 Tax=Neolewinella agarilytica TaxID=478744 RepID=A0A1H9BPU9_9BACT|nr:lipoprotein signal peptidase [Neolewinella agarilytica]SEP90563.1 signal peptidase II Aspartic peptidase. MEROPS family A08 [Neolewinella agarilytica]